MVSLCLKGGAHHSSFVAFLVCVCMCAVGIQTMFVASYLLAGSSAVREVAFK